MTFLTPKLRHRIQIQQATQTPNDAGGFDRGYLTLSTIWAELKPLAEFARGVSIIRGEATDEKETHEFRVRWSAVSQLGKAFSSAFDAGSNSIGDLNPIKSDFFVFLEQDNVFTVDGAFYRGFSLAFDIYDETNLRMKGRRFKLRSMKRDEVHREWIRLHAEEMEEVGTGWPK